MTWYNLNWYVVYANIYELKCGLIFIKMSR